MLILKIAILLTVHVLIIWGLARLIVREAATSRNIALACILLLLAGLMLIPLIYVFGELAVAATPVGGNDGFVTVLSLICLGLPVLVVFAVQVAIVKRLFNISRQRAMLFVVAFMISGALASIVVEGII